MKASKYNVVSRDNDNIYVLNTLYGDFLKISENGKNELYDILLGNKPVEGIDSIFVEKKFIVEENVDEEEQLQKKIDELLCNENNLNLIILPTERCNFRCEYCYESHKGKTLTKEGADQIIEFVERNIKGKKNLSVDWFGGEPLVALELVEYISDKLMKLCRSYRVKYVAGMTTNGYFLTADLVRKLKRLNICHYQITLDGFKETHDKQRCLANGKGSWEIIFANLIEIKKQIHTKMLRFVLRTNINKDVYKYYREFLDFWADYFSDDARFSILLRPVSDWGNIDNLVKEKFINNSEYQEVVHYALQKKLRNEAVNMAIIPGGLLCYAWKNNCYVIRTNGNLGKCTVLLEDMRNKVGHLSEESFEKGTWDFYSKRKPEKCKVCKKYPICMKVECQIESNQFCDTIAENLEQYLPMIADSYYKCIAYEVTK